MENNSEVKEIKLEDVLNILELGTSSKEDTEFLINLAVTLEKGNENLCNLW
jgi:hypothetical protein